MRAFVVVLGMVIAGSAQPGGTPPLHFRDIAQQAGLTSVPHFSTEKRYLAETVGGGDVYKRQQQHSPSLRLRGIRLWRVVLQSFPHAIAPLADLVASWCIGRELKVLVEILHHRSELLILDVNIGEHKIDLRIIRLQLFCPQSARFGFGAAFQSHERSRQLEGAVP